MTASKRRWRIAVFVTPVISVVACAHVYVQEPVFRSNVSAGDVISTVFLIGDLGRPSAPLDNLIDAISHDVTEGTAQTPRSAPIILGLGDNLYEKGLPHDLEAPGAEAEVATLRAIGTQFARIQNKGHQVPLMLIPGNHDYNDDALAIRNNLGDISRWYFLEELAIDGADAWTHLPGDASRFGSAAELFDHLEGDPAARVEFMAPMPIPGFDPGLFVIAVDSELILDLYAQGYKDLAASYWQRLEQVLLAAPDDAWLMIAAHHPPVTYGKHGRMSFGNWMFGQGWPQFPQVWQKALVSTLPLGILLGVVVYPAALAIAAAPALATSLVSGRKQDVGSAPYDQYAAEFLKLTAEYEVDAVLAGHDHSTQIIELSAVEGFSGDSLLVITGAGSDVGPVRRGPGTVAYLSNHSYVRVTQRTGGLIFEIIDQQGEAHYQYEVSS
jgi:3',5'-cyclic AMP phosphodiesterase CpdA